MESRRTSSLRSSTWTVSLAVIATFATHAAAESVNIELTDLPLTVPTLVYGAASGQAGVWNDTSPQIATLQPLVDTSGNLIAGAGMTLSAGEGVYTYGYEADLASVSTRPGTTHRRPEQHVERDQVVVPVSAWVDKGSW